MNSLVLYHFDGMRDNFLKVSENSKILAGFFREHWLKIAGASVCGYTAYYLAKVRYAYGTFKRMGIKTPKYRFFYGHYPDILEKTASEAYQEWAKDYGPTFGIFEGHTPVLITSDPDLIQEVFIKQFSNFMARKQLPFSFEDGDPRHNIVGAQKRRWKRQRNITNPTFSSSKLKELIPFIKSCTERFFEALDQSIAENQNIITPIVLLKRYTMDVICNCAFGIDIDCQKNPNNDFFVRSLGVFDEYGMYRWESRFNVYFPELRKYVVAGTILATLICKKLHIEYDNFMSARIWLTGNLNKIIDERIKSKVKRRDYVNILIEAKEDSYVDDQTQSNQKLGQGTYEKKITTQEIKSNLMAFMAAGFDTTSNALNSCLYILATHPGEQVKLQAEIDRYRESQEIDLDYDSLSKFEYLDMFIKEVLRMHPIGNFVLTRRCTNPCTVNGLKIPENFVIGADVLTLHYDPKHWGEDAHEFNPSRFAPGINRHPAVYMPFGLGPRNCVGMRFALLEMKLGLIKFLTKYSVYATDETPKTVKFTEGGNVRVFKYPYKLMVKPRNQ